LIRTHVSAPIVDLIRKLNQTLRGWANYHRYAVSSEAFSRVDTYVFEQLWRMLRRRHPRRSKRWLISRYWKASGIKHVFAVRRKNKKGRYIVHRVLRLHRIGITRYVKFKADANPYLPEFAQYIWRRRHDTNAKRIGALSARHRGAQLCAA